MLQMDVLDESACQEEVVKFLLAFQNAPHEMRRAARMLRANVVASCDRLGNDRALPAGLYGPKISLNLIIPLAYGDVPRTGHLQAP